MVDAVFVVIVFAFYFAVVVVVVVVVIVVFIPTGSVVKIGKVAYLSCMNDPIV